MNSIKNTSTNVNMTAANTRGIVNAGLSMNIITNTSMNTATATAVPAAAEAALMTTRRKKPSFRLPCSAYQQCL